MENTGIRARKSRRTIQNAQRKHRTHQKGMGCRRNHCEFVITKRTKPTPIFSPTRKTASQRSPVGVSWESGRRIGKVLASALGRPRQRSASFWGVRPCGWGLCSRGTRRTVPKEQPQKIPTFPRRERGLRHGCRRFFGRMQKAQLAGISFAPCPAFVENDFKGIHFSSLPSHPWRGLYLPLHQTTLGKALSFGPGYYEMIENSNLDHFQSVFQPFCYEFIRLACLGYATRMIMGK